MTNRSAKFISFEGIDGAGKSSQIQRLSEWLQAQGRQVALCRDPGSTPLGDRLREILLNDTKVCIHRRAEMLLYMAARAQLVEEVIVPALKQGMDVISDRFLLSNVAYQAYGMQADEETIERTWQVGQVATGGLTPDVTIVLDLPAGASFQRLQRAHDKLESRGEEYMERVRVGFLTEAARRSEVVVIDATPPPEEVFEQVALAVQQRFRLIC